MSLVGLHAADLNDDDGGACGSELAAHGKPLPRRQDGVFRGSYRVVENLVGWLVPGKKSSKAVRGE
jgi:hypothetical protein